MINETDYLFEGKREALPEIKKTQRIPSFNVGDILEFFYISESRRNDKIKKLFYVMKINTNGNMFGVNLSYMNPRADLVIDKESFPLVDILLECMLRKVDFYKVLASIASSKNMSRQLFRDSELFVTYNLENVNRNETINKYSGEQINILIRNKDVKELNIYG